MFTCYPVPNEKGWKFKRNFSFLFFAIHRRVSFFSLKVRKNVPRQGNKTANKMPLYCSSNSWESACQPPNTSLLGGCLEAVLPQAKHSNMGMNKILNTSESFRGIFSLVALSDAATKWSAQGGWPEAQLRTSTSLNQRIKGSICLRISPRRVLQAAVLPTHLHLDKIYLNQPRHPQAWRSTDILLAF